jgi:hypothetical protein
LFNCIYFSNLFIYLKAFKGKMTDFDPSRRFFTFYQAPAILASVVIAPVAVESALGTLEEVLAGDGEVADLAEIERAISTPVEVQLPASDPRITFAIMEGVL